MSIQAQISPIAEGVTSVAPISIPENGILTLSQGSHVVLDISPENVTGYSKSGADLRILRSSCFSAGNGRLRDAEKPDFQRLIIG
ncbi:hypothetical protein KSS93_19680 [Pseudomonas xanthosomatis]|uniref:hypothetical protein n=1 Tax=Pseudomonas xanthosomatis TaxID=2842356 RepID=UPI001C3E4F66|nr:hypothetical protein [Pseudomonas xanthosomatis]QXH45087.1 hypothetical protein KSS93_19680 [Pseudomonas xanthosomatis]